MGDHGAIDLRGVGKSFFMGEHVGGHRTAFQFLARRSAPDQMWALRNIDLSIAEGEVLGVVGTNGSGKSTLLKIVSRVMAPTEGVSRTRGRVGCLLEVGAGFHADLTGRDNVFLVGSINGMRRAEIQRQFDDIVEFAGIGPFIDTPIKRYSSGMYLRLAFSVSAHLPNEILLVDEVLAVGDADFRRRGVEKLRSLALTGRTVLFVSHSLEIVRELCPRTIWLDGGQLRADGPTDDVMVAYSSIIGPGSPEL